MHITKILSFIVTMTLLLFSCIKDDESETINYINVNSQIPTFAGKQSLLVFFGTYCPDCKQVLPVIEEVWKELKDDPRFLLVTISRKETAEVVSNYWKENQFTMPFYLDTRGEVFSLFANNTIPRIYIINPDNEVVWMAVESLDISAKELIQKIKGLK